MIYMLIEMIYMLEGKSTIATAMRSIRLSPVTRSSLTPTPRMTQRFWSSCRHDFFLWFLIRRGLEPKSFTCPK